jgi:DNA-binding LytR/AlgR family response regulator
LCDDELRELENLNKLIVDYGRQKPVSFEIRCFQSGEDLLAAVVGGQAFDLLFLDVYMGGEDGVAIARKIREYDKACGIIFATNSQNHAINSYGVRAIQYLLKPLAAEDVFSALDQAMESLSGTMDRYVQIHNRQGSYRILLGDILYAESNAKVVTIHTRKQGNLSYYDRLDNLESQCDDRRFLRCHKSFMVNLDFAHAIVDNSFILETGDEIRISMSVAEAKEKFTAHTAKRLMQLQSGNNNARGSPVPPPHQ